MKDIVKQLTGEILSDTLKEIRKLTDNNDHTQARIVATAKLIQVWDEYHTPEEAIENPFTALHAALGTLDAQHNINGHITTALVAVRERLWKAVVDTANGEGVTLSILAKKLYSAM